MRSGVPLTFTVAFLASCSGAYGSGETPSPSGADAAVDGNTGPAGDAGAGGTGDGGDAANGTDAGGCPGAAACERVVFITTASYAGDLGGVAGADAKCQAAADASAHPRVQGRSFVAWLSVVASGGATSPAVRFVHGTKSYVLPGGGIVAGDWTELTSGTLRIPIDETEAGTPTSLTPLGAWTATQSDGTPQGQGDCNEWTVASTSFNAAFSTANQVTAWSSNSSGNCTQTHHLFCFER